MIFRSRIYYNIDKIAFCHEDLNQIKKKTDEDKELLRLVEKKNEDKSCPLERKSRFHNVTIFRKY